MSNTIQITINLRTLVLVLIIIVLAVAFGVVAYFKLASSGSRTEVTAPAKAAVQQETSKEEVKSAVVKAAPTAKTEESTPAPNIEAGTARVFAGITFIWVPAGKYVQGSSRPAAELALAVGGREEWFGDEYPPHEAEISRGFWLSKNEITRREWCSFMKKESEIGPDPDIPMTDVLYGDCQAFLDVLNGRKDGVYALPSEKEWEYACRAGSSTFYLRGDSMDELEEEAWLRSNSPDGKLHPTGKKTPNAWGLCDMLGNAWEWCEDVYAPYGGDSARPLQGYHVIRGGGVNSTAAFVRCAYRLAQKEDEKNARVGLRLKRNAD